MGFPTRSGRPRERGAATRVAIVDDHPIIRRGLAQLIEAAPDLEMAGEAAGYSEAVALFARQEIDVAVVDLSLTDGSGLEVVAELRAQYPEVRSVVFSIHDAELYAPRALKAGALGFVSKTQPVEEVLVAIRALAAGRAYVNPEFGPQLAARGADAADASSDGIDQLSDRELQVFELIGRGLTTGEIARTLQLSPKTVETHRQRIKGKLGIDSGTKLLIRAAQWVAQSA